MKIAIPTAQGLLCPHFGHCEKFALIEVNPANQAIIAKKEAVPPPHEPGVLPRWLAEQKVNVIIAGGMGQRAQSLFAENNIRVIFGAPALPPETLVEKFLKGTLETGANACDH